MVLLYLKILGAIVLSTIFILWDVFSLKLKVMDKLDAVQSLVDSVDDQVYDLHENYLRSSKRRYSVSRPAPVYNKKAVRIRRQRRVAY